MVRRWLFEAIKSVAIYSSRTSGSGVFEGAVAAANGFICYFSKCLRYLLGADFQCHVKKAGVALPAFFNRQLHNTSASHRLNNVVNQ